VGEGTAMSDKTEYRARQWVSLPGGSLDVRLGTGVIEEASSLLKSSVGKPRAGMLVVGAGVDEELVERVRRQMTDAGYTVERANVAAGRAARTLESATALFEALEAAHITSDDLVVAVGDEDVLSLASYACTLWCGGTVLVTVPITQLGMLEVSVGPRGIDVGSRSQLLTVRPSTKHVLFDTDVVLRDEVDEDMLMARVLMVVTAMCDSEKSFSKLWDRSEDLVALNREVTLDQLQETVKLRGKILSSTALATRQSIMYGEAFARAISRLVVGVAPSTARAEALRFQARLAAGEGMMQVDDVLAQDELLEALELPVISAHVDPTELIAAIKAERFEKTNRFLLGLPRSLGRVRLAAVSDELIAEHVAAWCASREA
jgi:3-dehydroquinate synthetase